MASLGLPETVTGGVTGGHASDSASVNTFLNLFDQAAPEPGDTWVWSGTAWEPAAGGSGSGAEAWTTYVPALTASSSNPSLGSDGGLEEFGYYQMIGDTCLFQVQLSCGVTSPSGGSGTYYISLPETAHDDYPEFTAIGSGQIRYAGAPISYIVVPVIDSTPSRVMLATNTGNAVTHSAPAAFGAATDRITLSGMYRVAAA